MATSSRFTADVSGSLGGPGWLCERRAVAFARWESAEMPAESEEIWRYSRIDQLDLNAFSPVAQGTAAEDPSALPEVAAFPKTAGLLWTHDGQVTNVSVSETLAAKGVVVSGVRAAAASGDAAARRALAEASELTGTIALADDAVAHLAEAFADDVIVVSVPDGVRIEDPVVVVHWSAAPVDKGLGSRAVFPRTLIVAGEGAQVTVLEITASPPHLRSGARLLAIPVTEIAVGDNAEVAYVSVQDLGPNDWQIAHQASAVGRDARFVSFTCALGGDYARVRTDSHATGSGSETRLLAAYFGAGGQMHDFRTLQDHDAPHTRSDLYFKGAVAGEARSVYSGLIRIRKGAVRSTAFQENRNLVLSEGAHADSVPNLDIQENDVRCSHASAVGPVDPDQCYYLESRGVLPEEAQRLVVEGFFDEIVERAPDVAGVRALMHAKVAAKLSGHL